MQSFVFCLPTAIKCMCFHYVPSNLGKHSWTLRDREPALSLPCFVSHAILDLLIEVGGQLVHEVVGNPWNLCQGLYANSRAT